MPAPCAHNSDSAAAHSWLMLQVWSIGVALLPHALALCGLVQSLCSTSWHEVVVDLQDDSSPEKGVVRQLPVSSQPLHKPASRDSAYRHAKRVRTGVC